MPARPSHHAPGLIVRKWSHNHTESNPSCPPVGPTRRRAIGSRGHPETDAIGVAVLHRLTGGLAGRSCPPVGPTRRRAIGSRGHPETDAIGVAVLHRLTGAARLTQGDGRNWVEAARVNIPANPAGGCVRRSGPYGDGGAARLTQGDGRNWVEAARVNIPANPAGGCVRRSAAAATPASEVERFGPDQATSEPWHGSISPLASSCSYGPPCGSCDARVGGRAVRARSSDVGAVARLDLAACQQLAKELVGLGMSAVVYCGSMGDWPLLTTEQRMEGVERLVKAGEGAGWPWHVGRRLLRLDGRLALAHHRTADGGGALALFRGRNEDDPALAAQAARGDRRSAEGGHLRSVRIHDCARAVPRPQRGRSCACSSSCPRRSPKRRRRAPSVDDLADRVRQHPVADHLAIDAKGGAAAGPVFVAQRAAKLAR